jgi:hypothetical protein
MVKESLNKDQRKELLDLIVNFRSSEIYDKLINDKFLDYLIYVNDEYKRNLPCPIILKLFIFLYFAHPP